MINPSASVNAKSLLTVAMTITPVAGEPVEFLISEGVKLTNLKYLEDGKEVLASGIVKVIKWNYIKLPESETDCVHTTKSVFTRQCQPKSLVMDCSGEFESDVREIPVLAIRGCEAVDSITGDDPVVVKRPKLTKAEITGTLDAETGILSSASIALTFDTPIADEELEDFVNSIHMTITDTTVQDVALAAFDIVVNDAGDVFNLVLTETLSMDKLSVGDMVVVQSDEGTDVYALTENDIPVWEKPVVEFTVSAVTINEDTGVAEFTVNGVTRDEDAPAVVILNNREAVEFDSSDVLDGDVVTGRTVHFDTHDYEMRTIGNGITVVGPGYILDTEAFDAIPAVAIPNNEIESQIAETIEKIKTALANASDPAGYQDIADAMYIPVLRDLPSDQVVSTVAVGSKEFDAFDTIQWSYNNTVFVEDAIRWDDRTVRVHLIALLTAGRASVDITVTTTMPTAGNTRAIRSTVAGLVKGVRVYPEKTIDVVAAGVVGAVDGYKHEMVNTETGAMLIREHQGTQLSVKLMDGSNAVPNGSLIVTEYSGEFSYDAEISLLTDSILIPPTTDGEANKEAGNVKVNVSVVAPEIGAGSLAVTINELVRKELAISKFTIDGDINYDDIISNAKVAFLASRELDKATIANALLTIYGTTITDRKIGVLTSDIEVAVKDVVATLPPTTTIDASIIKNGGVAKLVIGDEVAITDDITVPVYEPPVLRSATITGTPDFETGDIADGKLIITFNETLDLTNVRATLVELNETVNLGMVSGVTNVEGVITAPLSVNAADLQSHAKITVVVARGKEEFKVNMLKGTHYPTWEAPPVLERVELTGTPDETTGMIDRPVVKVTLDKTTNMADATISIETLGITNVALTGPNAVPVDNTVSVSLTEGVSLAGDLSAGVKAVMVNNTFEQEYTMVAGDDYPTWTLPVKLTRVQIADDDSPETPAATIANATITLTFNQKADLSDMTTLVINGGTEGTPVELVNADITGSEVSDDNTLVVTASNLDMTSITGDLVATVSGSDESGVTYTYTLTDDDYPKYVTPTE